MILTHRRNCHDVLGECSAAVCGERDIVRHRQSGVERFEIRSFRGDDIQGLDDRGSEGLVSVDDLLSVLLRNRSWEDL